MTVMFSDSRDKKNKWQCDTLSVTPGCGITQNPPCRIVIVCPYFCDGFFLFSEILLSRYKNETMTLKI